MATEGVYPIDISSPVGQVRYLIGDVKYTTTNQTGIGLYTYFSDKEIDNFLTLGSGSPHRATGYVFNQWASLAADEAKTVQDTDLKVDLEKRYKALVERANWFFAEADKVDAVVTDDFQIVPTGKVVAGRPAELTARWFDEHGW